MKWSIYTREYPFSDGKTIFYNYSNDSTLVVEDKVALLLRQYREQVQSLSEIHPSLYQTLKEKSFIVDQCLDEQARMICRLNDRLSVKKSFRLTINPTLDCNLRCWYCYQSHTHNCYMSQATMESVYLLIESILQKESLEFLDLGFFGGEPLLRARQIAIPIASKAKELCSFYGKTLRLHFTSNGVLLNDWIISSLRDICPSTVFQIPFDGGRIRHNQIKKSYSGEGSYDRTLQNVKKLASSEIMVNIRCNYDIENIDSFEELIYDVRELTKGYEKQVQFSLQKIWQAEGSEELERKKDKIEKILAEGENKYNVAGKSLPRGFCYADYNQSLVVNYNGDLFKCTARDFVQENRMGFLNKNGSVVKASNKYNLGNRYNKDCYTCTILPICTICSQMRSENTTDSCPVFITNEDKERQIKRRLELLYGISV